MDQLYIEGVITDAAICLPASSLAAVSVLNYSRATSYNVTFVEGYLVKKPSVIKIPLIALQRVDVSSMSYDKLPSAVKQCALPAIQSPANQKVLSGLCCIMRNIIQTRANQLGNSQLRNLLGHKEICLKACAEVSAWTKFCEVEMPAAVDNLHEINSPEASGTLNLPVELHKLENQFKAPVVVANISKRRRQAQKARQTDISANLSSLHVTGVNSRADVEAADLTGDELNHNFVEGIDFTLADLALFPLVTLIMHHWKDHSASLQHHFQRTWAWCHRMQERSQVKETLRECCLPSLPSASCHENVDMIIREPCTKEVQIRETKHTCKKFKASETELRKAMTKFQHLPDFQAIGTHQDSRDVQLPWQQYPDAVHPKEGDLPAERLVRKCQQLENLVGAIKRLARPGHTVVDFCSGGGHLGIVLAFLLPDCKIILVENKEESIDRAEARIKTLKLTNVTIYQCNLDYFHGTFDIGTCLHACGVATDLVLQTCLTNNAAFVVCPCCYGSIHDTHTMSYPRSVGVRTGGLTYKEYLCLGHGADQTQFNTPVAQKGKQCMMYIDSDRAAWAQEHGYKVILSTLNPTECSPKNNLLVGTKS